jgi:hypothetical protein
MIAGDKRDGRWGTRWVLGCFPAFSTDTFTYLVMTETEKQAPVPEHHTKVWMDNDESGSDGRSRREGAVTIRPVGSKNERRLWLTLILVQSLKLSSSTLRLVHALSRGDVCAHRCMLALGMDRIGVRGSLRAGKAGRERVLREGMISWDGTRRDPRVETRAAHTPGAYTVCPSCQSYERKEADLGLFLFFGTCVFSPLETSWLLPLFPPPSTPPRRTSSSSLLPSATLGPRTATRPWSPTSSSDEPMVSSSCLFFLSLSLSLSPFSRHF